MMVKEGADIPKPIFALVSYAIVIVAAGLRFWDISQPPLWMDEAFTVLVGRLSLSDILFSGVDNHPPLPYAIQHLWMKVFPDLDRVRVPSAIAGTLMVVAIIAAFRDLWSRQAALWAGALTAVSTSLIFHSQDARMYSFLMLGLTMASWGLIGTIKTKRDNKFYHPTIYVIGALIAAYSHVTGLIFLACLNAAALGLFVHARTFGQPLRALLVANAIVFFLALPWLIQLVQSLGSFPGIGTPGLDIRATAFFLRNAIGYPGLPHFADYSGLVLLLLTCAAGLLIAMRAKAQAFAIPLASALVAYPAVIIAINMQTPILAARVLLPMMIPIVGFAAMALAQMRPRPLAHGIGAALFSLGLVASVNAHFNHTKHDNPRAALLHSKAAGYAKAPVITCQFFDAAAVLLTSESLGQTAPIITMHRQDYLRFDWRLFETSLKQSLASFRRSSPAQIDTRLGGGYFLANGLGEALASSPRAVFISGGCEAVMERIAADLNRAGFKLVERKSFRKTDRIIMEKGESDVFLYSR